MSETPAEETAPVPHQAPEGWVEGELMHAPEPDPADVPVGLGAEDFEAELNQE